MPDKTRILEDIEQKLKYFPDPFRQPLQNFVKNLKS